MKRIQPQHRAAAIILAAAALIAALFGVAGFDPSSLHVFSQPPIKVTVTPVSTITKDVQLVLPGAVEDRKAAIISAQISGRVSEVYVTEGQLVQAGQPLVSIEGMITADTGPGMQIGDTARLAQTTYDNSLQEYSRFQKLYTQGAIARRQLEASAARLQAAQEALSAAQASRQPVATGKDRQPGRVNLLALAGGTVTGLSAASGKTVQAGEQLLVLQNEGEVRIVVHLEQKDLNLVQSGTPVEITSAQTPWQGLAGHVEGIYPEIATDHSSFRTHIQVDNADSSLRPGMVVSVRLNTDQTATVRAVPATAIIEEQGVSYLYLAVGGRAVRQQVSTGPAIEDFIEITSELPPTALVITSAGSGLKDGAAIAIK